MATTASEANCSDAEPPPETDTAADCADDAAAAAPPHADAAASASTAAADAPLLPELQSEAAPGAGAMLPRMRAGPSFYVRQGYADAL